MIVANQEIAIHLKMVRNLTGYTSGRFSLRLSLIETNSQPPRIATPFNIIEKSTSKHDNGSEIDDRYYSTRTLFLKGGSNVPKHTLRLKSMKFVFSS